MRPLRLIDCQKSHVSAPLFYYPNYSEVNEVYRLMERCLREAQDECLINLMFRHASLICYSREAEVKSKDKSNKLGGLMAGKYSVDETKQVLDLVKSVAVSILVKVKEDGFQFTDLGAFLKSPEFDAALGPALENIADVPAELKELDFLDAIALGRYTYDVVQDILLAIK